MSESSKLLEANQLLEKGEVEEARTRFLEMRSDPELVSSAWMGLGRSAYAVEDWGEAQKCFNEVLALDEENAEALTYLGLLQEKQGQREESLKHYHKALELDPEHPTIRLVYGRALLEERQPNQAEVQLQAAIHLKPDNPLAYYLLGCAFVDTGRPAQAVLRFQKSLEVDSKFAEAYSALGRAFIQVGRNEEAASTMRKALRELPPNFELESLGILAEIAASGEDFQVALQSLNAQTQLTDEWVQTFLTLSQRAMESGHLSSSEQLITSLLEALPENGRAWEQLGVLHEFRNNLVEAEQALRKALELSPETWTIPSKLGWLILQRQDLNAELLHEAIELLSKASKQGGAPAEVQLRLAYAYQQASQPARARRMAFKVARNEEAPEAMVEQARDLLRRLPSR